MKQNNSGITLVALVITVIVMIIIASISVYEGKQLIGQSKAQTLETNMLTIQAKARAYAEEVEAKVWAYSGDKKTEQTKAEFAAKGMLGPTQNGESLEFTFASDGLSNMGLDELSYLDYSVVYDKNYKEIDIIYLPGIEYKGKTYNKLSELKNTLENE